MVARYLPTSVSCSISAIAVLLVKWFSFCVYFFPFLSRILDCIVWISVDDFQRWPGKSAGEHW